MWLFDWLFSVLNSLGLWNKEAKIIFLGLDNAGKTTLLFRLRTGQLRACAPTTHPNYSLLNLGKCTFSTYDLGGHVQARRLWPTSLSLAVNGILFVVDASDPSRFLEAKAELDGLFTIPECEGIPIAVFGNKIDAPGAVSEEELRKALGLYLSHGTEVYQQRREVTEVWMGSVVENVGYGAAFKWLASFV